MKKETYSQLELFSTEKNYTKETTQISKPLLLYLKNYEKTILIIIGFITIGIVSFSLGVENGKRVASYKLNYHMDMATKIEPPLPNKILNQQINSLDKSLSFITEKQEAVESKSVKASRIIQNYTIQVASYQVEALAQREADLLRKKGFSVSVIPKGKHIIVCVGNFKNKESAHILLTKLRKQYQDCFVRRL